MQSSVIHRSNVIVARREFCSDENGKNSDLLGKCSRQELVSDSGSTPVKPAETLRNDNGVINNESSHHCQKNNDNDRKGKAVEKLFSCGICNKSFQNKSYFEYHLRTHTGERPHQCDICQKGFFERSKLNRHLSSCHNVKSATFGGGGTEYDYEKSSNVCPKCNKTFSRSSGLQAHLLTHQGARPFSCKLCQKTFSGLTALKNHEKGHQGVKKILCEICGKSFLLKKYLDLHLNTTHKKEQRNHRCPKCNKEFHSAKDLKRHQLMHSDARNFKCMLCQTCFKRKDNLNRHLKLTHSVTPEQNEEQSVASNEKGSTTKSIPIEPVQQQTNSSVISAPVPQPQPQPRQVSVIKSTQEFIMSIARNQL